MASILTIRPHSGLSGDILLTGLAVLLFKQLSLDPAAGNQALATLCEDIMPGLANTVQIEKVLVQGIAGWHGKIDLPHEHAHRTLTDICQIIKDTRLTTGAQELARKCFETLALCEAKVHGKAVDEIHFHEVGALDSILDICLCSALFTKLSPDRIICAPLPMADGIITCAHGVLPAPAPAVLQLLSGIPVCPFQGPLQAGELITPTALVLIKTHGCEFGSWPSFTPLHTALVYGDRIFEQAANGAIFAWGIGAD